MKSKGYEKLLQYLRSVDNKKGMDVTRKSFSFLLVLLYAYCYPYPSSYAWSDHYPLLSFILTTRLETGCSCTAFQLCTDTALINSKVPVVGCSYE